MVLVMLVVLLLVVVVAFLFTTRIFEKVLRVKK